jgi:excisionase family DNA binding protein
MKDQTMSADFRATPDHALPALLTIEQTAKHLQVSTKTVRRLIDAGDLIAHRFGRGYRISESDLHTFIRMRREA